MAVTLRLLAFLACLPLLAPTGSCRCSAGFRGGAPANQVEATSHDCDDCCGPQEAAPVCPSPHDDHAPCCPAAALDDSKWTKRSAPLSVEFSAAGLSVIAWPVDLATAAGACAVIDPAWPSTPPRYISHCALRF